MYTRNPTYLKNALEKRILKGNEPFYTKETFSYRKLSFHNDRKEILLQFDYLPDHAIHIDRDCGNFLVLDSGAQDQV